MSQEQEEWEDSEEEQKEEEEDWEEEGDLLVVQHLQVNDFIAFRLEVNLS